MKRRKKQMGNMKIGKEKEENELYNMVKQSWGGGTIDA